MPAIPFSSLFADRDATYLPKLKSQAFWLSLKGPDQAPHYLDFHWAMASTPKFQLAIIEKVNKAIKKVPDEDLYLPVTCATAWAEFDALAIAASTGEMSLAVRDVISALYLFNMGYSSITSHLDKSQEIPQSFTARENLFPNLAKQLGIAEPQPIGYDANVMIRDPFDEGLPQGVTMSREAQVELGIVCSSSESMLTSVGNAGGAALENFFMMRWGYEGSDLTYSIFSIMSEANFEQIAALAGVCERLDEDGLLSWLDGGNDTQAFLATLYVQIQANLYGRLSEAQGLIAQRLELLALEHAECYARAQAKAKEEKDGKETKGKVSWLVVPSAVESLKTLFTEPLPLANQVTGRGIKIIRLRNAQGYDIDAVPLLNTGLMRDIQQLPYSKPEDEHRKEWWRLFDDVALGGSKPQNAGTFFTAFIRNGRAKVIDCPISGQNGGLRWLKQRIREGRSLYVLTRTHALEVCPRKPQQGTEWLNKGLHRIGKHALIRRLTQWVDQVFSYYESLHDLAVTERQLSITQLMAPSDRASISAERRIILGQAVLGDYTTITHHLGKELARQAVLTLEEKRFIRRILPQIVCKRAQE